MNAKTTKKNAAAAAAAPPTARAQIAAASVILRRMTMLSMDARTNKAGDDVKSGWLDRAMLDARIRKAAVAMARRADSLGIDLARTSVYLDGACDSPGAARWRLIGDKTRTRSAQKDARQEIREDAWEDIQEK